MTPKTWFITGCSRGFGRCWAEAALKRGDRVAATARDVSVLAGLAHSYGDRVLPLTLDVRDREAAVDAVSRAHGHFGRLDVVVNNAGYGLFGAIEEVTETEARTQIDTNLFGVLWVTQAALPYLRRQRSGHILQVSSLAGILAVDGLGLYHASKWALEGLSEALALEVADFGVRVTIVEPGGFETDWGGSSAMHAEPLGAYDAVRERMRSPERSLPPGDPAATAGAILALVDAPQPPIRVFLGASLVPIVREAYLARLATWETWEEFSTAAHGSAA